MVRSLADRLATMLSRRRGVLFASLLLVVSDPVITQVRVHAKVPYAAFHPLNVILAAVTLVCGAAWALLLWGDRRAVASRLRQARLELAFPLWAMFSALWASAGLRTLFLATQLLLVTAVVELHRRATRQDDRRASILLVGAILCAGSLLMVWLFPTLAITGSSLARGAWRGVMPQKNWLGAIAAWLVLTALPVHPRWSWAWRGPLLALGLLTAWGSRSATGWLMIGGGVGFFFWAHLARRFGARTAGFSLVAAVLCVGAGLASYRPIAIAFGRDPSMTGRTAVWSLALKAISEAPILGHGYRDRFHEPPTPELIQESAALIVDTRPEITEWDDNQGSPLDGRWIVAHAHNGWLDVAVSLGLPVAFLFSAWLAWVLWPALRRTFVGKASDSELAFLTLSMGLVLHNVTEASFLYGRHASAFLWLSWLALRRERDEPPTSQA